MEVRTQVRNNLLIAETANNANNSSNSTMPAATAYKTNYVNNLSAVLEPVSSTTGFYDSFWYTSTKNAFGSGNAINEDYKDYDVEGLAGGPPNAFNTNYGFSTANTAQGYVDYVFALQAQNADGETACINMTKCDLTYAGNNTAGRAARIAVLVQSCSAANNADGALTTKTILGCNDSTYESEYFDSAAGSDTLPDAVSDDDTLSDVTTYGTKATIATLTTSGTFYYKVTIRLWLEGEDTTCNNETYATLTSKWSLDLMFELQDDIADAVDEITLANKATNTYTVAYGATGTATTFAGRSLYSYSATLSDSTPVTIYGDNAARDSVAHWYIGGTAETEIYEITNFVFKATT